MKKTHHDYWKTFYELLTKNYIESTFEPDFCNLNKGECPDFRSDSIGLEIVSAASESQNALKSLLRKYWNKNIDEIPVSFLNTLGFFKENLYKDDSKVPLYIVLSKENGRLLFIKDKDGKYLLFAHIGLLPSDEFNSELIVDMINAKIDKLNKNYDLMSRNVVGVYIDYPIIPELLEYRNEMANIMKDYIDKELLANLEISKEKMFDDIYICFPDVVYKFDPKESVFDFKILEVEQISAILNKTNGEIEDL